MQARPLPVRHGLLPARPTPPFCPVSPVECSGPARPTPPAYATRRTSPACPARPRSEAEAARPTVHAMRRPLLHTGSGLLTGQQPLRPWPWLADLLQFLVAARPPNRVRTPRCRKRRRRGRRPSPALPHPNPCWLSAPPLLPCPRDHASSSPPLRPNRTRIVLSEWHLWRRARPQAARDRARGVSRSSKPRSPRARPSPAPRRAAPGCVRSSMPAGNTRVLSPFRRLRSASPES